MIISIGGAQGSGKSTLARQLAERLGWPHYFMGGLRREAARKRGLSLAEYNKLGETDQQTDLEVDEFQRSLGETSDNFVIEGRTSWHFIPHSLKLFLEVSPEEGARRILNDLESRPEEVQKHFTLDDLKLILAERKASDELRYRKYFNIEVYDPKNYDFLINTTHLTIKETMEKAWEIIDKQLKA